MALSKKQRAELKQKFGGHCAYCGCVLGDKWHADHVEAVYRSTKRVWVQSGAEPWQGKLVTRPDGMNKPDKDHAENIFPACVPCNLFKSVMDIEQFRREITKQADRARDYSVNFRTAERFGMIQLVDKPVTFWFESYIKNPDIII